MHQSRNNRICLKYLTVTNCTITVMLLAQRTAN